MSFFEPHDPWLGEPIGDWIGLPPVVDPWLGQLVGERDRYRLESRLGSGGMGEVFLATDTLLDQPVALKLLSDKLATADLRKRFEREVAVCAALRSEHIVHISDYGVMPEGYPFYVMEYLQGQTLDQVMRQECQISVERTINIITQICAGLQLAHDGVRLRHEGTSKRVKVVHRDLKPGNIFLVPTALGELAKILDFGIAKIHTDQADFTNITNVFLGTFRYAAPEQFEIGKGVDERTDIYSLGMILYRMLTGTNPFGFDDLSRQVSGAAWGVAHLTKPTLPLRAQPNCSHLPLELEDVVMRCLEKSPDDRFSSVRALSQALEAAIDAIDPAVAQQPSRWLNWLPFVGRASRNRVRRAKHPTSSLTTQALHHRTGASSTSLVAPLELTAAELTTHPSELAHQPAIDSDTQSTWSLAGKSSSHAIEVAAGRSPHKPTLLLAGAGITAAIALVISLSSMLSVISQSPFTPTEERPNQGEELPSPVNPLPVATKTYTGHADTVWTVATSPDLKTFVSGSYDRTIKVWDLQSGALLDTLEGHQDAVRDVAISTDGTTLVSGSGDKTIKVWDLQTRQVLRTLSGHSGPVWSVSISPDKTTIASGSYDGTIKIWNLNTGEMIRALPDHYDSVWSVAISPNGQTLVSGSYDGTLRVWNVRTGEELHTLRGHTDAVRAVAVSADSQLVASGSWDKTVRIWDLQTGELLRTLSGHSDRVVSVAIDPAGKTLASGSLDKTIKVWDLQTGEQLHTLSGHSDWVNAIAYTRDGKALVSGSKDTTARDWQF
ncbi:serine/threonine protein kinase [Oculatella sp. LEGE 06141]|uniref:serine/threonine-protein kinase n=1 Tax=Oculatella sp. LEGE 06141 TaxID=1828648 RepID=UPI00187F9713|nr:serine/threonine-protein kinase [Oculatella sp. LEGE 06141]MBE9181566.1 serine/threonine protein kinase [Oculatella sp. LEGE 06141]